MEIGNPNTSIMQISDKGNVLQFVEKDLNQVGSLTYSTKNLLVKNFNTDEYFMPILSRTDDGKIIKTKVINIGPWDMDTTAAITVLADLSIIFTKILSIMAIIIDDNGISTTSLAHVNTSTGSTDGGIDDITGAQVALSRRTGGIFDATNYNDAVMNRGYIAITYYI